MFGTKITRQRDGRMESYMVGTKITRQRIDCKDGLTIKWSAQKNSPKYGELNGQHENNSPKGWTGKELNGRHENDSPKDGGLNCLHENDPPKTWMAQK